jgi:hypothetical protein
MIATTQCRGVFTRHRQELLVAGLSFPVGAVRDAFSPRGHDTPNWRHVWTTAAPSISTAVAPRAFRSATPLRLVRQEYITRHDSPLRRSRGVRSSPSSIRTGGNGNPCAESSRHGQQSLGLLEPRRGSRSPVTPLRIPRRRMPSDVWNPASCCATVAPITTSPGTDLDRWHPAVPENNIADGLNSRIRSVATMAALTFPTPERTNETCRPFRDADGGTRTPRTRRHGLSWRRRSIGATSPVMPRTPTMDCASTRWTARSEANCERDCPDAGVSTHAASLNGPLRFPRHYSGRAGECNRLFPRR